MSDPALCPLADLGLLCFDGPDARSFLQGQLSNDTSGLHAGALLRAGLHTPQGRIIALLALCLGESEQQVRAVLPRELTATVAATLGRYVLRSKVRIGDESGMYQIHGITGLEDIDVDDRIGGYEARFAAPVLRGYASGRGLIVARATDDLRHDATLTRQQWRALDIAAGLPQVYLSTSAQFVAQMLNLDCIDAISFSKGCYTGQEVIARAHYRGRVKRRMQRWISEQPIELAVGDAARLTDGRPVRVVEVAQHADGRCEFLAVAPLAGAGAEFDGTSGATTDGTVAPNLSARPLPLPYPLPE